jgi:hypothetical protein
VVVVVVMVAVVTKNVHLAVITAITTVIKLIRLNTIKLPWWDLFLFTVVLRAGKRSDQVEASPARYNGYFI